MAGTAAGVAAEGLRAGEGGADMGDGAVRPKMSFPFIAVDATPTRVGPLNGVSRAASPRLDQAGASRQG